MVDAKVKIKRNTTLFIYIYNKIYREENYEIFWLFLFFPNSLELTWPRKIKIKNKK